MSAEALAKKLENMPRPCDTCTALKRFQCSIHKQACFAFNRFVITGKMIHKDRSHPYYKPTRKIFNKIYSKKENHNVKRQGTT